MTTAAILTPLALPARQMHSLRLEQPATLIGSPADLYLASPEGGRRFLATLVEGTLLPGHDAGPDLLLQPRRRAVLVPGGGPEGAGLWLAALRRAMPGSQDEIGAPASLAEYSALTRQWLAAITGAQAELDRQRADSLAGRPARIDRSFDDTLNGFRRLLAGTFRRRPDGVTSALGHAAAKLAATQRVKPVPIRQASGEGRDAFLERFAAGHGLRLRRVALDRGVPPDGNRALLLFDAEGAPWILRPRRWGGFMLVHPEDAQPDRRLRQADWGRFGPDAFMVFRTLPARELGFRQVLSFGLLDSAWDFAVLGLCGLAGALLALLPPLASDEIANIAVHTADMPFLIDLLTVLAVTLVAETTFFVVGRLSELRASGRAGLSLHAAMLDRLLRLTSPTLRGSTTLILATQMESVEKLRRSLVNAAVRVVLALLNGLAAAALIATVSPAGALAAAGLVVPLLAAALLLGWAQFRAIYEGERMDVIVLAFVYDLVRLAPVVRAMRLEKRAFTHWGDNFLAFQSRLMRSTQISNRMAVIEPAWEAVVLALCFAVLAYAGATSRFAAGEAIVFVLALGRVMEAGREMAHQLMGACKLLPMAKLSAPLLHYEIEPLSAASPLTLPSTTLEARGVSFFHGTRRILEDVDLHVAEGEFLGIAGPSGSGKSTLLALLAGLEKPRSGRILIGGHDLSGLERRQVAHEVALVMQGSRLLPGSLYDNIRGTGAIGLDEAWHFAEQAAIADEIAAFPMGLHTRIGENGAGLAEGQIQRLLIARALARQPRILLLDESMGVLDGRSQERILGALARLPITRILVAHRPTTLSRVDRLITVRDGAVHEGKMHE